MEALYHLRTAGRPEASECVVDPVCRHSEYSLPELGHTLIPIIEQLRDWGRSAEGRLPLGDARRRLSKQEGKNDFRPRMEAILKEKEGK